MSKMPSGKNWFVRLMLTNAEDEYEARIGRLFNAALLGGLALIASATGITFYLLQIELGSVPGWAWLLPFLGVLGTAGLFVMSKRGRYHDAALIYALVIMVGLAFAVIFFDGPRSPAWLIFIWALVLISVFVSARLALRLLVAPLVLYALLVIGQQVGMYRPLVEAPREALALFDSIFGVVVLTLSIPMVANSARYLRETLQSLDDARERLQQYGETLEAEVTRRTEVARRQAEEFRAVADLGRITASILDLEGMLTTATELIAERFNYYQVNVFLLDEDREWLVLKSSSTPEGRALMERGLRLQIGQQGIVGYVAATGASYIADDVTQDIHYYETPEFGETRSEATVPLELRGQLLGVLDVESAAAGAFTEQDTRLLRIMADSLAVAVQNALRFEQAQHALEKFSRYQEQEVLQVWREMLRKRGGYLGYLYDRVRVSALQDADPVLPVGERPTVLTVSRREDGAYLLLTPLEVRGKPVGRFAFESDVPWTEDSIQVVKAVVAQLGLALENARLLEETRRRAILQETTGAVTARIRSEVEIEAILERALTELGQALGADHGMARLLMTAEEKE